MTQRFIDAPKLPLTTHYIRRQFAAAECTSGGTTMTDGEFPRSVRIGVRATGWRSDELVQSRLRAMYCDRQMSIMSNVPHWRGE